jgi:fucose permease
VNYPDEVAEFTDAKSATLLSCAQGLFAFGQFFATFCMKWINPRHILAGYVTVLIIVSALSSGVGGTAGVALYMVNIHL